MLSGYKSSIHGYGYVDRQWQPPRRILTCSSLARPGYESKEAHEYEDVEEVLTEKVKELVRLMKLSNQTLLYTGAGISTAAGVGDYASARGSQNNAHLSDEEVRRDPMRAQPTRCHRVLTDVCHKKFDLIQCWMQQNHDGLPQKAGFPQYLMNEIHGSWYDPSNPVVPMKGTLRTDLFQDLFDWEQKASLVIALGTSLCGMNADRCCEGVYKRHRSNDSSNSASHGLVLCNLQETVYDEKCVLRIYCNLDKLGVLLERELLSSYSAAEEDLGSSVKEEHPEIESASEEDVFFIPYDAITGKRIDSSDKLLILDLREGALLKLTAGQYEGDMGEVVGKNMEGHYKIRFKHALRPGGKKIMPFERVLGAWWIEQMQRSLVNQSPVVNVSD